MSNKRRKPTMNDVARLAGVNRVTASVALNGATNARTQVSEETRQRILDAARELGYAPNRVALALRANRTNIIGLYSGSTAFNALGPFGSAILRGLQEGCRIHGQDLLLFSSFGRDTERAMQTLLNGSIDGLIALPSPNDPVIDRLADSYLSVVTIANEHARMPSLIVEESGGPHLIAQYLAEKGHRHILYCGDVMRHTSAAHNQQAFVEAAAGLGLQVDLARSEWKGSLRPEETALLLRKPGDHPTAVVCWSDTYAYRLIDQLRVQGIHIPQDVGIVGFDTGQSDFHPIYNLTTVRAPWQEVAMIAIDILMATTAGQEVARKTTFPVELVIGNTV
jgi:LacI family transcriptional regulator